jgi:hypothetical protein
MHRSIDPIDVDAQFVQDFGGAFFDHGAVSEKGAGPHAQP